MDLASGIAYLHGLEIIHGDIRGVSLFTTVLVINGDSLEISIVKCTCG